MLEEFQNSNGVAFGQRNSLIARHDLLCGRQSGAHDETCEIQLLVCGGGREKTLLFARCAQLDSVVAPC